MAKPIRITIKGTDNLGFDAPTVEDLLSQVQDFVSILHGVEDAIADGDGKEIDWRVTDASKNSPLTLEVTPFPKRHAMNIDNRAAEVVFAAASGFASLSQRAERPKHFSDPVIRKTEKVIERITNGLDSTLVDVSAYEGVPPISLDRNSAQRTGKNLERFRSPDAVPYRELGSIEGFISKVELDGYNRPVVWLKSRIDGQSVKCIAKRRGLW
ncbi:hypothetical protein, partial [Marivita geojedonensis]